MILPPQARLAWEAGKAWFILGSLLAVFALGAFVGHRWSKGSIEEAKRARDNQAQVAAAWKGRSEAQAKALGLVAATQAENEKAAKDQREEPARILADLQKQKRKSDDEREAWRKRYAEAIQSPDCAELAKVTTCAAFRSF